ncbi:MAG: PTS sugar transporter subunit IIA [Parachlamydiales bacterium]|nr:PTS sugar transporter subunit IIA [Parachlamydiales bacterium]
MDSLLPYLNEELIVSLDVATREEAISSMVALLANKGYLTDQTAFYQAVLDREKLVSTGIGMGVALPHAKLSDYDDFFITIAILKHGINWDAQDGAPVRLVFMIGGPDDKQTLYLQILSRLTYALKDEARRKKMLQFTSSRDIIALFEKF